MTLSEVDMPKYGIQYCVDYEEMGRMNEQQVFEANDDGHAKRKYLGRARTIVKHHTGRNTFPLVGPIRLFRLNKKGDAGVAIW